ncbi:MAG: cytochrome c biogenesis protein CcsA [Verrucomicrobium sp.]|nr:cytochrome c biogenesis protein CcsA [Verrucomicrobium sp.]
MIDERNWLAIATGLTLLSAGWGAFALGAGRPQSTRWNNVLLAAAWACQSLFLEQRGRMIGHCPLTNLFETVAFLTWGLLFFHLVVGSGYRLSLLGFFTAPVVSLINFFALVSPIDRPNPVPHYATGWPLELHASLTVLAYGALGLGAVAAFLYLVQERQLREHHLGRWFFRLPAMGDLAHVQRRLLVVGFVLLTLGLGVGLGFDWARALSMDWVKLVWSAAVWAFYLFLLLAPAVLGLSARRGAWCALGGYLFVLLTFWGINSLSHAHRFAV